MMFMSGEANPLSTENNEEIRLVLQHRERQLEAIRQVSDALFTHPGTEPLARETLLIALNILRAEAGAVYLHDPVDNTLICSSVIGGSNELIGTRIPANNGIA